MTPFLDARPWWQIERALVPEFVPAFGGGLLADWCESASFLPRGEESSLVGFLLASLRGAPQGLHKTPQAFRLSVGLAHYAAAPIVLATMAAFAGAQAGLALAVLDTPGRVLVRLPSGRHLDLYETTRQRVLETPAEYAARVKEKGGDPRYPYPVLSSVGAALRARDSLLYGASWRGDSAMRAALETLSLS